MRLFMNNQKFSYLRWTIINSLGFAALLIAGTTGSPFFTLVVNIGIGFCVLMSLITYTAATFSEDAAQELTQSQLERGRYYRWLDGGYDVVMFSLLLYFGWSTGAIWYAIHAVLLQLSLYITYPSNYGKDNATQQSN